ncbi:MAG: methyltransferase domain-containing protein [Planctomycetaceae bacterium]
MDDPTLDDHAHRQALAGLRRINWWSRTDSAVYHAIRALLTRSSNGAPSDGQKFGSPDRPLTILDIASGGGDLVIRLAKRFAEEGIAARIQGCDISPTAIEYATSQARQAQLDNVRFTACNALEEPFPQSGYDVVMCSLFLHHLTREQGVLLMTRMKQATQQLLLVDDLRRTALGYWLAWVGCRILSRSRIVHYDGPVSVAGAFSSKEAMGIAHDAGLAEADISHHWPQRFLLSWRPTSASSSKGMVR